MYVCPHTLTFHSLSHCIVLFCSVDIRGPASSAVSRARAVVREDCVALLTALLKAHVFTPVQTRVALLSYAKEQPLFVDTETELYRFWDDEQVVVIVNKIRRVSSNKQAMAAPPALLKGMCTCRST